jgi:hypothetical protein
LAEQALELHQDMLRWINHVVDSKYRLKAQIHADVLNEDGHSVHGVFVRQYEPTCAQTRRLGDRDLNIHDPLTVGVLELEPHFEGFLKALKTFEGFEGF